MEWGELVAGCVVVALDCSELRGGIRLGEEVLGLVGMEEIDRGGG